MKAALIPNPTDTITFGEKKSTSRHVHMDFSQGRGNDIEQVEQGRHGAGGQGSGGSNFAFADGSVRFLHFGRSLKPVNLWAVTEEWRHATAKLP
jgi:prepilin-type processing-associated H-X9-DG protein